jgi:hypothetical protein
MNDPHSESARLRAYYFELSEQELNEIGSRYDTLTEDAQTAIRAEFDRRGMPAPELADDEGPEFQSLVTLRYYRDLPEAQVAKSALDSAGIFAFLRDENVIRIDWGYSNAVGGIRLQVRQADANAAEEVLSQPIPPTIEADSGNYEQPRCPSCQSLDIKFEEINPKIGLASILIAVPVPWPKQLWSCNTCGAKWEDIPDNSMSFNP